MMMVWQAAFEEQLARLKQGEEEGAVRVGIQIRVGDGDTVGTEDVFEHGGDGRPADAAVQLDDYHWYFDCADQIGRAAAGGGKGDDAAAEGEKKVRRKEAPLPPPSDRAHQGGLTGESLLPGLTHPPTCVAVRLQVVWYLASDSETLREQAMARYGPDRLVTRLGQHRHTQFSHCPPREARACRRDAILDIAGDILALTRTDYQVGWGVTSAYCIPVCTLWGIFLNHMTSQHGTHGEMLPATLWCSWLHGTNHLYQVQQSHNRS